MNPHAKGSPAAKNLPRVIIATTKFFKRWRTSASDESISPASQTVAPQHSAWLFGVSAAQLALPSEARQR
jgi:hypothetical protein